MANFHKNLLVLVAEETDMRKVLETFEKNLRQCSHQTGFQGQIEVGDSIYATYSVVERYIDSWYQFAFCPNPTGVGDDQSSAPFDLGGFFVSFTMAASGRALSESATVNFKNIGSYYALSITYDTAWEPNSADLDYFFRHLPRGLYGIAFYHADEGDEYESIGKITGLHRGSASLFDNDRLSSDWTNSEVLKRKHQDSLYADLESISDAVSLAETIVEQEWDEFGWEEDEFGNSESWGAPSINWRKPTDNDLTRIDPIVLEVLASFPQIHEMNRYSMEEHADAIESLSVGERVIIKSAWDDERIPSEYEYNSRYVIFEVETTKGVHLGRLHDYMNIVDDWQISDAALEVLACLLPHINAAVESLNPVSLRNAGVTSPEMKIRFDMEPVDLDQIILEVHETLEMSFEKRSQASIRGEEE